MRSLHQPQQVPPRLLISDLWRRNQEEIHDGMQPSAFTSRSRYTQGSSYQIYGEEIKRRFTMVCNPVPSPAVAGTPKAPHIRFMEKKSRGDSRWYATQCLHQP